jgi:hypothetical protein
MFIGKMTRIERIKYLQGLQARLIDGAGDINVTQDVLLLLIAMLLRNESFELATTDEEKG